MMRRPTGWKPDKPDARDYRAAALLSSQVDATQAPRQLAPSLARFRTLRYYQGSYNACWAFAMARALHLNLLARGYRVAFPSPSFLYWIGRSEEYAGLAPDTVPPLLDTGTYARLGIKAVQDLGFVEWSAWKYPERVGVRPHPGIYLRAISQADLLYGRIDESGDACLEVIREALFASHPVIVGLHVGRKFEEWRSWETIEAGAFRDRDAMHMVTVLEDDPAGRRVLIDNWWTQWGMEDGTAWVSYDAIGDRDICSDRYMIRAATAGLIAESSPS